MSGNQEVRVKWLIKEFPNKKWSKRGVEDFQKQLWTTGSIERAPGSERPRTTRTAKNVDTVDLVQSQENQPKIHRSTRQISWELGIPQTNKLEMTFSVLFCCDRKWTKNNIIFNWKVLLFKFTKYGAHTITLCIYTFSGAGRPSRWALAHIVVIVSVTDIVVISSKSVKTSSCFR